MNVSASLAASIVGVILFTACGDKSSAGKEGEGVRSMSETEGELAALAILAHTSPSFEEELLISTAAVPMKRLGENIEEVREQLLQSLNTNIGLRESTVDAFLKANSGEGNLDYVFPQDLKFRSISEETFQMYFKDQDDLKAGWMALAKDQEGPKTVCWISRLGHSPESDQALIWVESSIGGSGSGNYYMLTLLSEHWAVEQLPIPSFITHSESIDRDEGMRLGGSEVPNDPFSSIGK